MKITPRIWDVRNIHQLNKSNGSSLGGIIRTSSRQLTKIIHFWLRGKGAFWSELNYWDPILVNITVAAMKHHNQKAGGCAHTAVFVVKPVNSSRAVHILKDSYACIYSVLPACTYVHPSYVCLVANGTRRASGIRVADGCEPPRGF